MWPSVLFLCLVTFVLGELELTDEQYYLLPKLFDLDDQAQCLSQQQSTYCLGTFELLPTTDRSNELFQQMKDYSLGAFNFNHTRLHRGFCVTSRCPELENFGNSSDSFEKCVSSWTMRKHGFSAHLIQLDYCRRIEDFDRPYNDVEDLFYLVVKVLFWLNMLGLAYDIVIARGAKGNSLLMAWSVRSNWRILVDNNLYGDMAALQATQFVRVLGSSFVVLGHVILTTTRTYLHNPRNFEMTSKSPASMILHNGTVVVQMFILLSSFFLAYKIQHEANKLPKKPINLRMLPKMLLRRLIRIAPTFWLVVGYAATWWPRLSSGPVWPPLVEGEAATCRQLWWWQVMMVANLIDSDGRCLPQTWSLAADLQLYVIAVTICLLLARKQYAIWVLTGLLITSILLVFGASYMFDLKAMMIVGTPENMRTVYQGVSSISVMYLSPWANSPSCFLGLLLGHIQYRISNNKRKHKKKEEDIKEEISENEEIKLSLKFVVFRSLFFIILAWLFAGNWVKDNASPVVSSVYAALERPVFGFLVCGIIYGGLNKIDRFWLDLGSWRGWNVPGRLSLSVVLLHWICLVSLVASRAQPVYFSALNVAVDWATVLISSYLLAVPLTLMVEMPVQRFLYNLLSL